MKLLCSAAAGVLSILAFTISREGYVGISDPPLAAFSLIWLLYALLFAGLWFLFIIFIKRVSFGQITLGFCFGVVNYFAAALFAYDTWEFLSSFWQWGKAILQILGQAAVMTAVAALVCHFLESVPDKERQWIHALIARVNASWIGRAYQRRPVLFVMGVLLLCWLPYLFVFYPGTISWDNGVMIGQFFGAEPLESWHPVFYTWLMGGIVAVGRGIAGDNLGAFLFVLFQTAVLSYALARVLLLLRRFGLSLNFQFAALAFFALTPIFASYAQAVYSDTLYTALLLLFCVQMCELLQFGYSGVKQSAAITVSSLLCSMVRGIGLYVVLVSSVFLVVFSLRGKVRVKIGMALALPLALFMLFQQVVLPELGIVDISSSAIYSLPFQQSARVLRDHADTVTEEEIAEIDRVLEAENLPLLYESVISDPVKFTFRQYGSGKKNEIAALVRYRNTWFSMMKKYPLTYLEAFVAGNTGYYAFTPKIDSARTFNYQGGVRFYFESFNVRPDERYLHTTQIEALQTARELLAMAARGWRRVPVLELFLFCASYTWLLIIAALSLLRQKRRRMLIAFLPALLSLIVCLFSPVNDYFRYFLPIVAMTVPLLALAKRTIQTV